VDAGRIGVAARAGILALIIAVLLCLSVATAMPGMDMSHALIVCCALAVVILTMAAPSLGVLRAGLGAAPQGRRGAARRLDRSPFWPRPPDRVSLRSLLM
jgi:hypothetical protein